MKHKLSIILSAIFLCLMNNRIFLHASEPLTASIQVSGNAGRKITLTSTKKNVFPDKNPEKQDAVIGSNGYAGFSLTYDEPDDYVYVLTTDDKADKPVTVEVTVYVDDKTEELRSVITAYDTDGKKINNIDFTRHTEKPVVTETAKPEIKETKKPVTTTSVKNKESANTGMNSDPEVIVGITAVLAGLIIAILTGITMKHFRREN